MRALVIASGVKNDSAARVAGKVPLKASTPAEPGYSNRATTTCHAGNA